MLLGKWLARMNDADAMVSEVGVHLRHVDLLHMAARALGFSYGAGRAGMIFHRLLCCIRNVATPANWVVVCSVGLQLPMRIVTCSAGEAVISCSPALAGDQPVRSRLGG